MTADEFYKKYASAAAVVEKSIGIDKNIILAWWSWETDWGTNSGTKYNNLGGIKYTKNADFVIPSTGIQYSGYNSTESYAKDYVRVLSVNDYGYPEVIKAAKSSSNDVIAVTKAMNASKYAEDDYNVTTIAARAKAAALVTGGTVSGGSSTPEKNGKPIPSSGVSGSGGGFSSIPRSIRLEIMKKVVEGVPMFEPTPIKTNFYNELKKLLT